MKLSPNNPAVAEYFEYVHDLANTLGVRILYGKGKRVRCSPGQVCNGYFDERTLAVATDKPFRQWFPTFIHEACHMNQYAERSKYWGDDMERWYAVVERHHAGEDTGNDIITALNKIIALEADCERRAVKTIAKFGLPVCQRLYAKQANSYLLFYPKMLEARKWYTTAPYEIPSIWAKMPDVILPLNEYKVRKAIKTFDLTIFDKCLSHKQR